MLAFAFYLLKMTICSAVFFGYYWLLLRNKVFHGYNRFYLLVIIVLSIILPLCEINIIQQPIAPSNTAIQILQVVTNTDAYVDEMIVEHKQKNIFTVYNIIAFAYSVVSLLLFCVFVISLIKIALLIQKHHKVKMEDVLFINTAAAKGTPFSFFNYIFWNSEIDLNNDVGKKIFLHEQAHIKQRHSYDKVFTNVVLIIFWINPIYWLIRKELNMIHEFVADKQAVSNGDTALFATMILATTYPTQKFNITNHFFYSPIKRRLLMLTKNQNPQINYLSRIIALPLLLIVFAAFTLKAKYLKNDNLATNLINNYTNTKNSTTNKKAEVAYLTSLKKQNKFATNELEAGKNLANNKNSFKYKLEALPTDTVFYKGKAVKKIDISVDTNAADGKQITGVKLTFEDNTYTTISYEEALKNEIKFPEFNNKKQAIISTKIADKLNTNNNKNEEIIYFYKGEFIKKEKAEKILKEDISEITILDSKSALENYNIVTNGKLMVIATKTKKNEDDKIFVQSEQEAEFVGGNAAWANYLRQYLNPDMAKDEGWKPGTYNVMIKFIVEKDGSISDVAAENYTNTNVAKKCIGIIKHGPNWKPATQNGHIVKAYKRQPITFLVLKD